MSKKVVLQFIEKINSSDIDGIIELMSDDHLFIDNIGNELRGKEKMKEGWNRYFNWFPDYKIAVTDMFESNNTFLLCGSASGTFQHRKEKDASYNIPAAWKAVTEHETIKLWQVFADTKVQFDIIERYSK